MQHREHQEKQQINWTKRLTLAPRWSRIVPNEVTPIVAGGLETAGEWAVAPMWHNIDALQKELKLFSPFTKLL
jgi:hypothetical protein